MNGSLVFVLLLVSVVMCAQVAREWLKHKQKKPEVDSDLEETLAKIATLEERVKVLERIITENRFDLKSEIDSL